MLDHLLWGVSNLDEGIRDLAERSGVQATIGGRHPGVGTHNALLDLEADRYLEIIAADPSQDRFSGFGLLLESLRRRAEGDPRVTPGLLTWAARTDDIEQVVTVAHDAGLAPGEIIEMSRSKPDGEIFEWRLLQIGGHSWGPLLPFFIQWRGAAHPCHTAPTGCRLEGFSLTHPDSADLRIALSRLGLDAEVQAGAEPALRAVLATPRGTVRLEGPPFDPGTESTQ